MSGTESALADSPGHLDGGDDLLPAALGAHPPDRLGLKRMEVVPVHGRETVGAGRELGADWRKTHPISNHSSRRERRWTSRSTGTGTSGKRDLTHRRRASVTLFNPRPYNIRSSEFFFASYARL